MLKKRAVFAETAKFNTYGNFSMRSKEIKDQARGRWDAIFGSLAPHLGEALKRPGFHVPCPEHGGKDGFRVFHDVAESGGGICNTCGNFSDGFALLQWINGWTFSEALEAVAGYLGMTLTLDRKAPYPRPSNILPPTPDKGKAEAIKRVWGESLSGDYPAASPLRLYLEGRAITLARIPETIRFHPALYSTEDKKHYPAMLALVSGPDGDPVTVHRTFLTLEGKKAPLEDPKKLMSPSIPGATKGGAIRLFEAGSKLAIAEGIETALSVHLDTGLPVWAGISAGGVEAIVLPDQVEEVLICADNDDRGKLAAARLARRLLKEGRRVFVSFPPNAGEDWNDAWKREVCLG